ncbi:hypothetical protein MMON_06670 [Mycolicibacterium monacense]|uniref:Uncharacterized protein n=1 Tax=Mycolicibacterium monacense TaxID=85693 RepID=A0AAD1IR14_MYCMB|nr:hypothetical protein MMON_06670 [Mycolicibacterium monacense]
MQMPVQAAHRRGQRGLLVVDRYDDVEHRHTGGAGRLHDVGTGPEAGAISVEFHGEFCHENHVRGAA